MNEKKCAFAAIEVKLFNSLNKKFILLVDMMVNKGFNLLKNMKLRKINGLCLVFNFKYRYLTCKNYLIFI